MTTISREDALKVVQEQLDFLDEPMEKGTARLILKLIELIPDSGSYTREQMLDAYKYGHQNDPQGLSDYLASLPAHGDGWISVEDRLPEPVTEVECYSPKWDKPMQGVMTHSKVWTCATFNILSREWEGWIAQPTHWRELSSPPVKK